MINIYFSTEKAVRKYIETHKEYFDGNFGRYWIDYLDQEMVMSHLDPMTFFEEELK